MSIAPLFILDMNKLKKSLRLSAAKLTDCLVQIDDAVQEVRYGFFDALGPARIATILTYPSDDNPTTDQGVMRLKANSIELKWVRMILLRIMPVLFKDASADVVEQWNQEALVRNTTASDTSREIQRLQNEINDALIDLVGDKAPDAGTMSVTCIGPKVPPPLPGASVWPSLRGRHACV